MKDLKPLSAWRRIAVGVAIAVVGLSLVAQTPATADEPQWRHGVSLIGPLKYPADYKHFDYVNVNAPKGGTLRLGDSSGFDNFNIVLTSVKGNIAPGADLIYERLMTASLDEISSEYGDIAEALKYPDDYSSVTFRLRPDARWQDGEPITPEDVVWSFEVQTANDPQQQFYYSHVKKAEATGPHEVTFSFDQSGNRELPQIVGELRILPKHWWTANGADGQPRDITRTTLEPPLGSGPYKIKSFEAGKTITYERVKDYWAANQPFAIGTNNFDEIRYDIYRDDSVELEAFKGDNFDFRSESSAKNWATAYDIPAKADGRIILEKFPERASGAMSGFVMNLRRSPFNDDRVRLALSYLFDFEEINRTIFFGQYEHVDSYFYPTELMSRGLPEGRELEILQAAKEKGPVPAEVFTTPFKNPVGGNPTLKRANQREALKLLNAAGWVIDGGRLVNAKTREPMRFELLISSPLFERVALPYKAALAAVGIDLGIRQVDTSQYINRVIKRDFDMIVSGWAESLSPGNEQQEYFGSASADRDGSKNYGGIKNPAVDFVIHEIIYNKGRDDLVAATKALDRLLLWNHYVIPGWTLPAIRIARWDRFSHPDPLPKYSTGLPTIWWWDAAKAAKTGGRS
ncbi:MAG: extracellular solute-binding protein [Ancalomicrobiaceae bacterium]|nr:extracellular solute-binding protein [Ancalomicrobiaceae bacterium]